MPFLVFSTSPGQMRVAWHSFLLLALFPLIGTSRPSDAQFAPVTWITRDTLARDWWPRVAPAGRTITFSRSRDGGATFEMMRTTMAGDPARPFFAKPPVGSATRGAWSKRHRRFAFSVSTREGGGSAAVWLADARGARAERLSLR